METSDLEKMKLHAISIRKKIINSVYHAKTGHQGPSLSMVEILTIIYFKFLNFNLEHAGGFSRDFLILSKGHGSPGLYAVLAEFKFIQEAELLTLRRLGSRLQGHPNADTLPWVDFSTGSLGQGLSVAIGLALGIKKTNRKNKVFCILGDGELQEGQNWEAAMSACKLEISNLVVIIDRNKIQSDGFTEEILPLGDLFAKWEAFGWFVQKIDGHDFVQLNASIIEAINFHSKPAIIIAETIKGKGISFMENTALWHHNPMSADHFHSALAELEL